MIIGTSGGLYALQADTPSGRWCLVSTGERIASSKLSIGRTFVGSDILIRFFADLNLDYFGLLSHKNDEE